jgi:flavin reductase (DIM6/NTAB) family NADH-FMN oxidoreductase RutF
MQTYDTYVTLNTAEREPRANYLTLVSVIYPRPIAFVSTISTAGVVNLAPYSFFNGVGSNPPSLLFCPCNNRDGDPKDTLVNLRAQGEFVVNVVPHDIRTAMNQTSHAYPPEVSELDAVGFTALPSTMVKPPRVAESPVQMECRLIQIVPVGEGPLAGNVCIGEVLCFHLAERCATQEGTADPAALDLVGRMGGPDYTLTRDRFVLPKPDAPQA